VGHTPGIFLTKAPGAFVMLILDHTETVKPFGFLSCDSMQNLVILKNQNKEQKAVRFAEKK